MSAIKNNSYAITLKGKEYNLLFSLNALDALQDRYGGYDKLSEVMSESNPNWVKETKWLLTMLINEGILAEDENAEQLTEERVGRLIHMGNIKEVQNAMYASFAAGMAGNDEEQQNEETDTENEEGETQAVQES